MDKVLVIENGKPLTSPPPYLKLSGNFNFFITIQVKGIPSTTSSSLSLVCYSQVERKVPLAALIKWSRGTILEANSKSNFYQCGPRDKD